MRALSKKRQNTLQRIKNYDNWQLVVETLCIFGDQDFDMFECDEMINELSRRLIDAGFIKARLFDAKDYGNKYHS